MNVTNVHAPKNFSWQKNIIWKSRKVPMKTYESTVYLHCTVHGEEEIHKLNEIKVVRCNPSCVLCNPLVPGWGSVNSLWQEVRGKLCLVTITSELVFTCATLVFCVAAGFEGVRSLQILSLYKDWKFFKLVFYIWGVFFWGRSTTLMLWPAALAVLGFWNKGGNLLFQIFLAGINK